MVLLYRVLGIVFAFSIGISSTSAALNRPVTRIERTITREFNTSEDPQIRLNTQKGQIRFRVWDEDRVEINITIASEGDSRSHAENGLDMVHIITQKSDNIVHIETDFEDQGPSISFWNLIKFWEENPKVTVDMVINVPVNSSFDITHQYGDLILPNIRTGNVHLAYGAIKCGHVAGEFELNADYSKGSVGDLKMANVVLKYSDMAFEDIESSVLEVAYSKFSSLNNRQIRINSKYSSVVLRSANNLTLEGKFDEVEIQESDDVKIFTKYTAINIGNVKSSIEISNSYQNIKVLNILPGFKNIQITGRYGNCELEFVELPDATFQLETRYGVIDVPGEAVVLTNEASNFQKILHGKLGQGGKQITVVNSFGNITLRKQ